MFKWPGTPSPRASKHELADYAELVCWKDNTTSTTVLSADLGRLEENDYSEGVPEEEEAPQIVEEVYLEIERREEACSGYPFVVGEQGYTLQASQAVKNHKHIIYKYLLLATRLNMKDDRKYAGIDGASLFEELASETAREYLGDRAESIVFGTAAGSADFPGKVDDLCKRIKEGNGYVNRDEDPSSEQDGKLDIVAWKHFKDRLPGKLIVFGQCKTGTNYKGTLTQLQPDSFCKKWFQSPLILTPVRMLFVAEALSRSRWANTSYDAGLLFDRCRIIDFCDRISEDVLEKVKVWTEAAAEERGLPSQ